MYLSCNLCLINYCIEKECNCYFWVRFCIPIRSRCPFCRESKCIVFPSLENATHGGNAIHPVSKVWLFSLIELRRTIFDHYGSTVATFTTIGFWSITLRNKRNSSNGFDGEFTIRLTSDIILNKEWIFVTKTW